MHVSLCSCYTIRIFISKTLTGTYEGGYTYVFDIYIYTYFVISNNIYNNIQRSITTHLKYLRVTSLKCVLVKVLEISILIV